MISITEFQGPHRFLSNFWPCHIAWDGRTYLSTEAAYQSAKTTDLLKREMFTNLPPGAAKRMGGRLPIRPDWQEVRLQVMREVVALKFAPGLPLAQTLLATGYADIIEGNVWNDTFWGVCNGVGKNHLGEILMAQREVLRAAQL